MITVLSNDDMRQSDAETVAHGTDSRELMRRAGEKIFGAYDAWGKTAVACGTGNNAGDGYVLALYLKKAGLSPELFLPEQRFSPDGRYYFDLCEKESIPVHVGDGFDFSSFDTIADCLFGTGFHGVPTGVFADCIEAINRSGKPVVSADINSGLAGDSGQGERFVYSTLTVAIQFYKPGHFLGKAKDAMKQKTAVDIGIVPCESANPISAAEESDFAALFPKRRNDTHKGTYGYVAILGGCTEYAGAAKLANLSCAALRSGCGVVKLAAAESTYGGIAPYLLESTFFPMPDDRSGHMRFLPERLDALFGNGSTRALACGMGWGSGDENGDILRYILTHYKGRLILDADGLNTLAGCGTRLLSENICESVTLTPHPMEFSRLTGKSVSEILSDPIRRAREFAARFENVTVLLKGTATVITDGKTVELSDRGTPGMASAGSGDVLSGILCGLAGSREMAVHTVCCGAYLAGLAAELAVQKVGEVSMIARDTVSALPDAVKCLSGEYSVR